MTEETGEENRVRDTWASERRRWQPLTVWLLPIIVIGALF